jgi:hypothetical protein
MRLSVRLPFICNARRNFRDVAGAHLHSCLTHVCVVLLWCSDCKLSTSCWGHAVLHAVDLVQLRLNAYYTTSPFQFVRRNQLSISHMQKIGCAVYTPISPPKRISMAHHKTLEIYVG